jgi:hypothetical protein
MWNGCLIQIGKIRIIEARPVMDIYDGAEWTETDIGYLKAAIAAGISIEEAAQFLCRAESDVRQKCRELGLA